MGNTLVLPKRQLDRIEAFLERLPGVKRVKLDGTKRPLQQPQEPEAQKPHDSGKKKHQTRKPLAAVNKTKRVLVLTQAREETLHDKRFPDEDDMANAIPEATPVAVAFGFWGLQKESVNIGLPHCKPRGALSTVQKQEKRTLSHS